MEISFALALRSKNMTGTVAEFGKWSQYIFVQENEILLLVLTPAWEVYKVVWHYLWYKQHYLSSKWLCCSISFTYKFCFALLLNLLKTIIKSLAEAYFQTHEGGSHSEKCQSCCGVSNHCPETALQLVKSGC